MKLHHSINNINTFFFFFFLICCCFCSDIISYESGTWCDNTENDTTGAERVNQIIIIIYLLEKINKKSTYRQHCMTMGCKHSPQVIIQVLIIPPVRYTEQSFPDCHTVITLSLCSPLLQIISITDNLNVMCVALAVLKGFPSGPSHCLPAVSVCIACAQKKG